MHDFDIYEAKQKIFYDLLLTNYWEDRKAEVKAVFNSISEYLTDNELFTLLIDIWMESKVDIIRRK